MTFHPYAWLTEQPGVTLELADLPDGEHARWYPRLRVLLMGKRSTQRERRCACAHESMHVAAGEGEEVGTRVALRQEQAADQGAARLLITLDQLAAVITWTNDLTEAALELNVTEHLLQVRMTHLHPSEYAVLRRVQDSLEVSA